MSGDRLSVAIRLASLAVAHMPTRTTQEKLAKSAALSRELHALAAPPKP